MTSFVPHPASLTRDRVYRPCADLQEPHAPLLTSFVFPCARLLLFCAGHCVCSLVRLPAVQGTGKGELERNRRACAEAWCVRPGGQPQNSSLGVTGRMRLGEHLQQKTPYFAICTRSQRVRSVGLACSAASTSTLRCALGFPIPQLFDPRASLVPACWLSVSVARHPYCSCPPTVSLFFSDPPQR